MSANEDDKDTVTASGEERVVEAILDDKIIEDQPNQMDEQPSDLQPADADMNDDKERLMDSTEGTAEEHPTNGTGVTSSRPIQQHQPPIYLKEYVRTILESDNLTPLEIGRVG